MGKNKNKNKGIQPPSTSKPANGASNSTCNNTGVPNTSKKNTLRKDYLGLALLIILTIGIAVLLYLQPWNTSGGNKTMRFKSDYVLCYNSSKYNVHAGDTVNIFNDNLMILDGDTVCVSDNLDVFTDNNEIETEQVEILSNENGTARLFEYTSSMFAANKQLLDISNDSIPFNAIEGELFEICKDKDVVHDRPLLVLGSHVIWPNYGIKEYNDNLELDGHEPIIPSIFKVFGDTLIVKFERTQSIYNVGIYPEYSNKLIANVRTDGRESKVFIGETDSISTYRLSTKNHISCLIQPTEAEIIEVTNPALDDKSQLYLLIIISIIAFVEFIAILVAGTMYFVKRKRDNSMPEDNSYEDNDEKQDVENSQVIELKEKIEEKERLLAEKREELQNLTLANDQGKTREQNTSSDMDGFEKSFTVYGKRPETDDEKLAWIDQLINSSKYEEEEFVKQISHEKKKITDESAFRQIALSRFDESYNQWTNLLKSQNEKIEEANLDESEQDNKAKVSLEQEIKAEEANLEQLRLQLEGLNVAEEIKSKDSVEKLQAQLKEKVKENQVLKDFREKAERKIEEAKSQAENKIKQATANADKQIKAAQEKAQKDIDKANDRADKAEEESKRTEERVTKKYEGTIKTLEKDIQKKSNEIQSLSEELSTTRTTLKTTSEELRVANDTIVAKENALDRFNKTITDIAPAKEYADSLEKLLQIGEKVEKAAIGLGQNKDVDDYLINKYITRYRAALSVIDMQMFTTDVLNATKAQFVYKGQMLATFDQKDKKSFYESMKLYFYDTYIKKYVDALVVLNETMVGMQYLADGATAKDVKAFETYRKEIDAILKAIEIDVISVKIMDSCTDNLSLTVIPKVLDFDCPKNSICQIDNCIVYLKGASKPNEKIQVIVKK